MNDSSNPSNLDEVRQQLAPEGTLKVALNMSNFLLVNATAANGEPDGVSPAIGKAIAEELGVDLQLVPYAGPGLVADAVGTDEWTIANIAAEAERARLITFSPPYCEIQASFLVPPGSSLKTFANVDQPGVRIAVKERAAYDLWLTANLQHASLHKAESLDGSFDLFAHEKLDALAGLRPKLLEQQKLMPGSALFEDSFTSVLQSIGCKPGNEAAARYLAGYVENAIHTGLIASLIEHYGVTGKLSVASRSTAL